MDAKPALVAAFALLLCPAAGAATYTADDYSFTADFPSEPAVSPASASERDATGRLLSTMQTYFSGKKLYYSTSVAVETFVAPVKMEPHTFMRNYLDQYVRYIVATTPSRSDTEFQGYPALRFDIDTVDHTIRGQGLMVVIPSEKPKVFIVIGERYPWSHEMGQAVVDKFMSSFKLDD